MTERSIAHGSFAVERTYKHAPGKVFQAWANPEFKRQWFGSPSPDKPTDEMNFRVGGREYNESEMEGKFYTFDVTYRDIVPDNRIVYTYEMSVDGKRMSVSLATIELFPKDGGTRMVVKEDGAFLDGLDDYKQREAGTNYLIDVMGKWLDAQP
ncbi:SRPBCC family protein [Devosia sp. ZB163]|uniref:SRPBCC family protein n=1 Tax=Devosia sp. ZB163 TaxID=3025938 RepID=UPI0023626C74|nr:SRPBCC family protein [Devosia sp. ZB163]MDC9824341.1 SRPBCC family protein [Devosia sp. ZB163]